MHSLNNIFFKVINIKVFPLYFESKLYFINYSTFKKTFGTALWLITRRILRFIKRVIVHSKVISVPFIISLFFIIIFLKIGFSLGEINSYQRAFWEFKDFFLTAIFITMTTNVFQEAIRYRKNISKQSYTYYEFRWSAENFIFKLSNLINFIPRDDHPILIFEHQLYDVFLKDLEDFIITKKDDLKMVKKEIPIEVNPVRYLTFVLKEFKSYIENTKDSIVESDLIGFESYDKQILNELIFYLNIKIEIIKNAPEYCYNDEDLSIYLAKQISEILKDISSLLFRFSATLRRPWRWDLRKTFYIKQILINDGFYFYEIGQNDDTNFYDKYVKDVFDNFEGVDKFRFIKIIIPLISFFTSYLIVFKIQNTFLLSVFSILIISVISPGIYKKRFIYYFLIVFSFFIKYLNIL